MVKFRRDGITWSAFFKRGFVHFSRRGREGGNRDMDVPTEFLLMTIREDRMGNLLYKSEELLNFIKSLQEVCRVKAEEVDPVAALALLGKIWSLAEIINAGIKIIPDDGPTAVRTMKQQLLRYRTVTLEESVRLAAVLNHQGSAKRPEVGDLSFENLSSFSAEALMIRQ